MGVFKSVLTDDQKKELTSKGKVRLKEEQFIKLGKYDWKKYDRYNRDTINNPRAKVLKD